MVCADSVSRGVRTDGSAAPQEGVRSEVVEDEEPHARELVDEAAAAAINAGERQALGEP